MGSSHFKKSSRMTEINRSYADVTVVIPCFNSESTISRAIESIFSQELLPKSIIVIDDKSTDNTFSKLVEIQNRSKLINFEIIRNSQNFGPGISRNLGWDLATTKWIAFLDSDDSWHPKKLKIQFSVLESDPEIDVICTATILNNTEQINTSCENNYPLTEISFKSLLFKNTIPTRSVILRKEIQNRFPAGLSEDFSLWLSCLDSHFKVVKIEAPLAIHFRPEFSKGGLSSQLLKHEYYELRRIANYLLEKPLIASAALVFSCLKFLRRLLINLFRGA